MENIQLDILTIKHLLLKPIDIFDLHKGTRGYDLEACYELLSKWEDIFYEHYNTILGKPTVIFVDWFAKIQLTEDFINDFKKQKFFHLRK